MIKGIIVKIQTTKDSCIRLTVDCEKAFVPEGTNLIKWQDQEVVIELQDGE